MLSVLLMLSVSLVGLPYYFSPVGWHVSVFDKCEFTPAVHVYLKK